MTQISPPVARVVAVLNFLAGHPEQAFTLTEIARSLKISGATCHTLLAALVEAGYVYRTAGKTYVLGPALVHAAHSSLAPELVMQVARPEMRLLADEFDVVCSVFSKKDDRIVIRERAAALSHIGWNAPSPPAMTAEAPMGGVFVAWHDDEVERWIAAATPSLEAEAEARLRGSLTFLRTNGYTFGVRTVPLTDPERARALQNQPAVTDYGLSAIDPKALYQLAYIAAPIFSRPGIVDPGLSLVGFDKPVKGAAIEAMGARLHAACERISTFIAGRAFRMDQMYSENT